MSSPVIHTRGLMKTYKNYTAVDKIDFVVHPGEIFGILGPNGAGKSSTMRMLATVAARSAGELEILGMDPATEGRTIRASLGVVPQQDNLDSELTVRENLLVYGRYFGIPRRRIAERADELLEFARLTDKAAARVESLSGGMKRRLTIARGLVNTPRILLLDEPTTGLDPQARHALWDLLEDLRETGVTLVLTTHYMDEAEQLCDRLIILDNGSIIAEGTPRDLIDRHSSAEIVEVRFEGSTTESDMKILSDLGDETEVLADRVLVFCRDGRGVVQEMHQRGLGSLSAQVRRSTLEDVFLGLTGRTLKD